MLRLGVILVSVALLFTLTALSVAAGGMLRHRLRVVAPLAVSLALGLILLLE